VDEAGNRISGATVEAYDIPLQTLAPPPQLAKTVTDANGFYAITLPEQDQPHQILATDGLNSLVYFDSLRTPAPRDTSVDFDIMQQAGSLAVTISEPKIIGTDVFFSGTAIAGKTNALGEVLISAIPPGLYDNLYITAENYLPYLIPGVPILASQTTVLPGPANNNNEIKLEYDPALAPPMPEQFSVTFDTLSQQLSFRFNAVQVSDFRGYQILRDTLEQFRAFASPVFQDTFVQYTLSELAIAPHSNTRASFSIVALDSAFNQSLRAPIQTLHIAGSSSAQSWDPVASLPQSLQQFEMGSTNQGLYVFGGVHLDGVAPVLSIDIVNKLYFFSFTSKAWIEKSPLPSARYDFASVQIGTNVYLIGGNKTQAEKNYTIDRYDLQTDTWTTIDTLSLPLAGHSAIAYAEDILIIGGAREDSKISDEISLYSIEEQTISPFARLSKARSYHATAVIDSVVYVHGGLGKSERNINIIHQDMEVLALNLPLAAPALYPASGAYRAELLALNNQLYHLGGITSLKNQNISEAFSRFDPLSFEFAELRPMELARHSFGASGFGASIFIIGGATVHYQQTEQGARILP